MNILLAMTARVYGDVLPVALRSKTALYVSTSLAVFLVFKIVSESRRKVSTTRLRGPPSPSFIYGVVKDTMESLDPGSIFEEWAKEYGVAFEIPAALGQKRIMLFDPKALQHFYVRDTWTYISLPSSRLILQRYVNDTCLCAGSNFLHSAIDREISGLVHWRSSS